MIRLTKFQDKYWVGIILIDQPAFAIISV